MIAPNGKAPALTLTAPIYLPSKSASGEVGVTFFCPGGPGGPPVALLVERGFNIWEMAVLRAQALNRVLETTTEEQRDAEADYRAIAPRPAVLDVHLRRAQLLLLPPAARFLELVPPLAAKGGAGA